MKRILVISAIAMAVGCTLLRYHAVAQNPQQAPSADSATEAVQPAGPPPASEQPADAPAKADGRTTVDQARAEYVRAEEKVAILTAIGLSTSDHKGAAAPANRPSLGGKLRPLVVESFIARQRLQRSELDELRRQLAEIERAIDEREQQMDAIVDSRVDELLAGRIGQAVTNVQSRVPGTVTLIAQIVEAAAFNNDSLRSRHREISVGDKVKAGDLLAEINSTQAGVSKAVDIVQILAPIDGVIVEKNVNVGDVVRSNDTLFQISSPVFGTSGGRGQRTGYVQVHTRDGKIINVPATPAGEVFGPPTVRPVPPAGAARDQRTTFPSAGTTVYPPAGIPLTPPQETKNDTSAADGAFGIETRERLARLDLQAAEEEYVAAEKALKQARTLREQGTVTEAVVSSREQDLRRAAIEVERAKIKLDGIARQRAELEAAAEADVAEAKAEMDKAEANVRVVEARVEAAEAQAEQLNAEVAAAEATYNFSEKRYERFKALREINSIDEKLLEEAVEQREAAAAALAGAKSSVQSGKANVQQAKAEVARAIAELDIARQRLDAAQARRDRLIGHNEDTSNQSGISIDPRSLKESEDTSNQFDFWIDQFSHNQYYVGKEYAAESAARRTGDPNK